MEYRFMRDIVRPALIAGILIAFVVVLGACAPAPSEEETSLVFGLSGDPDTLDPHATTGTLTFQTMRSVYDTLVEPDTTGEIVPALATDWTVSDDGLRWEFSLREGVVFHHGRTLSAADVVATIERIRDPEFGSPSAFEFESIESVEAVGDTQVVLTLSQPDAPLLATLASGWSAIFPADLIEQGHDFAAEPVGTGPFRFVEWVRDGEIVLERNEAYWMDGRPLLDEVRFQVITEPVVMAQALAAGQIDVADILVDPELAQMRDAEGVTIYESPSALVLVLAINTRRAPLNDLRVRRAINAAIDKQAVLDNAYAGGIPVGTFMDAGNPYYLDVTDLNPYDPTFAATVASETEFDRDLVIALPQNFQPHVRAGELYHEMLRQAGFPVTTRLVDWSTWVTDVYGAADFDLTVIGHTGKLDPHGRLAQYGTDATYVGWEDEPTATAIEQARRESDPEVRAELYDVALRRLAEGLPFVYLGSPFRYVGLDADLTGFHIDSSLDTADLRNVRFGP